jgi:Flp pilus assembly protein TadG
MNPVHRLCARKTTQRGAAAVEFALVATLFFMLVIGIMEMGRVLFYWNSATEATRLGARIAVVCDVNDAEIRARVRNMLRIIPLDQIEVEYSPGGCTPANCRSVTVRINSGVQVATFIPTVPLSLVLPSFSTTLPRESMQSTVDGVANPMCG